MDMQLVSELGAASDKVRGIVRLSDEAATMFVRQVANKYVADSSRYRWWESLNVRATHISYGGGDGLATLAELVGKRADVRLIVTDEEAPPWPVYVGDTTLLIAMLRECRFFEYILAAPDVSWVVFDTHMNELVCIGLHGPVGNP